MFFQFQNEGARLNNHLEGKKTKMRLISSQC